MPYDIYLKSTNDLVQSIIASLRAEIVYNYIVCEGSSDCIYLKYYLSEFIESKKLRILPLGGCNEVVKIMKNIELVSSDKNAEIKGSILGLIDTDRQYLDIDIKETPKLFFKRLLYNKVTNDIELAGPKSRQIEETQIEHALNPKVFLETVQYFKNDDISNIITEENFNKNAKCSWNIIDFTISQKDDIKKFFTSNDNNRKVEFANKYVEIAKKTNTDETLIPTAFREIIKLFKFNINEDTQQQINSNKLQSNTSDNNINDIQTEQQGDTHRKIAVVKIPRSIAREMKIPKN